MGTPLSAGLTRGSIGAGVTTIELATPQTVLSFRVLQETPSWQACRVYWLNLKRMVLRLLNYWSYVDVA